MSFPLPGSLPSQWVDYGPVRGRICSPLWTLLPCRVRTKGREGRQGRQPGPKECLLNHSVLLLPVVVFMNPHTAEGPGPAAVAADL